jgi:hypothetical protein
MLKKINSEVGRWFISYDKYNDFFQIYNKKVFSLHKDALIEESDDNFRIVYTRHLEPLLLEITNDKEFFRNSIEDLDKQDIIRLVKVSLEKRLHAK